MKVMGSSNIPSFGTSVVVTTTAKKYKRGMQDELFGDVSDKTGTAVISGFKKTGLPVKTCNRPGTNSVIKTFCVSYPVRPGKTDTSAEMTYKITYEDGKCGSAHTKTFKLSEYEKNPDTIIKQTVDFITGKKQ